MKIPLSEFFRGFVVPNVPCGVESWVKAGGISGYKLFLMYRVELKALSVAKFGKVQRLVPNVPCGVERLLDYIVEGLVL